MNKRNTNNICGPSSENFACSWIIINEAYTGDVWRDIKEIVFAINANLVNSDNVACNMILRVTTKKYELFVEH